MKRRYSPGPHLSQVTIMRFTRKTSGQKAFRYVCLKLAIHHAPQVGVFQTRKFGCKYKGE